MATSFDVLDQQLAAAEEAARMADLEAIAGVSGAAVRAERHHAEARALAARIKRFEASPAEQLSTLRAEWDRLFRLLAAIDEQICKIERTLRNACHA